MDIEYNKLGTMRLMTFAGIVPQGGSHRMLDIFVCVTASFASLRFVSGMTQSILIPASAW